MSARRRRLLTASALAALAACPPWWTVARAAGPADTLKLVLPFPAGATSDVLARLVAAAAARELGERLLVDNRPGAGGTLGTAEAARAAPDGRTLLWGTVSNMAIAPALYPNPGYDALAFEPVALLLRMPHVLTVHPQHGVRTVAELVALAQRQPGRLSYASSGNGTISHLLGELFQRRAEVQLLHVPYRSGPQGLPDHIAGRVDLRFDTLLDARAPVEQGRLTALAVTSEQRSPLQPEVPTMAEAGVADMAFSGWFGVYAPAGTPALRIAALARAFTTALASAEIQQALRPHGAEPMPAGPEVLGALTRRDAERLGALIRQARIQPG